MIRQAHKLLVSHRLTRRGQRFVVRGLKRWLSVPDAFDDLRSLIARTSPDAILDVGSHVGRTISRFLEMNSIAIHGFEPTAATFDQLLGKFASNPLVSVHKLALSDKTGVAELHNNTNEETNSLLDNGEFNRKSFSEDTQHVAIEKIETICLDDWMAQHLPTQNVVVKSDIQGAEGLLLAGGANTFRNQVIGFYSEAQIAPMYKGQTDFFALHRTLTDDLGFVLHNIYPCMHDRQGRALQTDALWIKEQFLRD